MASFNTAYRTLRSGLGFPEGVCKFYPSCSCYAAEALFTLPPWKSFPKIVFRLIRCNPVSRGGYDPVFREGRKKESE